ncbi:MAG: MFS transporter [Actinobacteria bacterium]|nr:MFS transporter [Actinomycetota bacterium]
MDQRRRRRMTQRERPQLVGPLFMLIMLATFAYFVSVGALQPTLPRFIEGPLGGDDVAVGVGIAGFSLSAVLMRPFVGRISDAYGRRILIVSGGLLVGVSTLGLVWASSLPWLIFLRFMSGVGEAAFYVGAATIINDLAPDERRGEALSYFSLALFGGLAAGPIFGELMLERFGYDAAWHIATWTAVFAALLAVRLPDTRPEAVRSKGLQKGGRIVHPAGVLPGSVLASAILGLAGFSTFIPLYALEIGLDGSRLVFGFFSAIVLGIRLFGARIPDILGARKAGRIALVTNTAGFLVMAMWAEPVGLFVGTALFSVGQSLVFPALMSLALANAPAAERGAVVGTFTAFFDLAFGIGAISLGWVASQFGYSGVFFGAALAAALGLGALQMATRPVVRPSVEPA